jgi:hypothetical protein
MKTCTVEYHFTDNNTKKSETSVKANPASVQAAGGVVFAEALAEALQAQSSATLTHYVEVYRYAVQPIGGRPATASDCYRKLLLFFRDAAAAGTFTIPSPGDDLPLDEDGPYRGARLDLSAVVLSGVLVNLSGILASTILDTGVAFPNTLRAGTLTRNVL